MTSTCPCSVAPFAECCNRTMACTPSSPIGPLMLPITWRTCEADVGGSSVVISSQSGLEPLLRVANQMGGGAHSCGPDLCRCEY
ncbi:hypothetical protein M758_UG024000 [Ceratodon purpureus]|nr:hypothetical protein M758_UG024000 [Ceratodon purpureus]